MSGIDDTLLFQPLRIAVLTISDTRTPETDLSGNYLENGIRLAGHDVSARRLIKDDVSLISDQVRQWSEDEGVDAVLTTGGTGLRARDVTLEAVTPLFEKVLDGFSIVFHRLNYQTAGLATLHSRACAGLAHRTLVFCLPGSASAVKQAWDGIIRDALDSRYRPASLVDLLPRLNE